MIDEQPPVAGGLAERRGHASAARAGVGCTGLEDHGELREEGAGEGLRLLVELPAPQELRVALGQGRELVEEGAPSACVHEAQGEVGLQRTQGPEHAATQGLVLDELRPQRPIPVREGLLEGLEVPLRAHAGQPPQGAVLAPDDEILHPVAIEIGNGRGGVVLQDLSQLDLLAELPVLQQAAAPEGEPALLPAVNGEVAPVHPHEQVELAVALQVEHARAGVVGLPHALDPLGLREGERVSITLVPQPRDRSSEAPQHEVQGSVPVQVPEIEAALGRGRQGPLDGLGQVAPSFVGPHPLVNAQAVVATGHHEVGLRGAEQVADRGPDVAPPPGRLGTQGLDRAPRPEAPPFHGGEDEAAIARTDEQVQRPVPVHVGGARVGAARHACGSVGTLERARCRVGQGHPTVLLGRVREGSGRESEAEEEHALKLPRRSQARRPRPDEAPRCAGLGRHRRAQGVGCTMRPAYLSKVTAAATPSGSTPSFSQTSPSATPASSSKRTAAFSTPATASAAS